MLDALPVEIVVEILTYLTAQDILRCQLISKRWCDLIEASLQLQYKIQAAAHGYEYREVTPNLSVGDYIAALHRMENLWTRCSLNDHNEPRASPVVVEVKHRGWLSAGQRILGRTIISRVISDHMNVQQNHSSREAIYVSSLESLKNLNPYRIPPEKDFDIVYDCDPLQDLMVTLEHPYGGNSSDDNILRAHTLSLCTGNFHPETSLHSISLDHCNWPAEDYDFRQVTISGSFVIVRWSKYSVHQRHTLDVQHAKIVLYHWPSGVTHMSSPIGTCLLLDAKCSPLMGSTWMSMKCGVAQMNTHVIQYFLLPFSSHLSAMLHCKISFAAGADQIYSNCAQTPGLYHAKMVARSTSPHWMHFSPCNSPRR
ncbi:hypothetical protein K474DRAFT_1472968 [Panus rudis PR-1116 ss-1]|nr:hypothetical protein K474DRAFT_1472968 [Panus rudis PR-1116 ss-1]